MNIIVLRNLSSLDRRALKPFQAIECPAFKLEKGFVSIPKAHFDYTLVTSGNAFRFVERRPQTKTWVFIGEASRGTIPDAKKVKVLKKSDSEGVLKFFSKAKRGSLFFPRSNLGDHKLVKNLRALGYQVTVRHTYRTKILNIRKPLLKILSQKKAVAFFVTSPSSFLALRRSFSLSEIRHFQMKWVVIGTTTAQEVRSAGLKVLLAPQASLSSMAKVLKSNLYKKPVILL